MTDHLPFVTKTAAGITFVTGTNLILSSGTLAVVNSPDFPGNLVVGQSASINQDVLFSGSINLVAGSGIAFDGRTISNTAASASIAGVSQLNGQTGTVLLNAGPGMSINTAGGTINVVNVGTITPGVNVILNSGTLSVPLSAGPGLNFSSGTFTNIATLVPGVNVLISGGSIGVPLYAGDGISFANATITNAGVLSVQGFTGNVSLVGGTGIDIVSNTVINTGVTAINGQTGSLVAVSTLTSGAGISVSYVSGTTIVANAGVLSFNNATGNVTGVSSVNGQTDAVILESGSGILVGAASGGTIPINNNGVLTVQGLSGNVSLVAGSGIDIASNTIINTGQSTPLSAGPGISIQNSTIINTGTIVSGTGVAIGSGTITNTGVLSVQGFTGNVSLVGGTGIDIVSNTVLNTGVTSINGQTGSLVAVSTLVSGAGIGITYASGTTVVENTGVLSFNNATGNVTGVSSVNGATDNITLEAQSGIGIGSPSGGTIPINNNGVLTVQGLSGNVSLVAGSGIDIASNTIINTGQSTPLSAGDNINISGGSIGVVPNPSFSGSVTASILTGQVLDIIGEAGAGTLAFGWTDFGTIPSQNVMGLEWTVGSGNIGYYMQIYDGAVNSQGTVLIRQWGPLNYVVYPQFTPNGGIDIPTQYLSGLTTGGGTLAVTSSGFATIGLQLPGSSTSLTATVVVPSLSLWNVSVYSAVPSAVSQNGTIAFATINVVNTATVSTPAPFQQSVYIQPAILQYANATLTNVQFSDISGATILPSWRESGTVNSGTALYWVLFSQGLPASSTTNILWMSFLNGQNTLNSGTTGLAPQLPEYYGAAYGTDDTGTIIFVTQSGTLYDNFAGTILSDQWNSGVDGAAITIDNGLTATIGQGDDYYWFISSKAALVTGPIIAESYANPNSFDTSNYRMNYIGLTQSNTISPSFDLSGNEGAMGWIGDVETANGIIGEITFPSQTTKDMVTATIPSTSTYHVFTIAYGSSTVGFYYDYTFEGGSSSSLPTVDYVTISNYEYPTHTSPIETNVTWTRARAYPPLGIAPLATLLSVPVATVQISAQYNDPNAGAITADIINTTLGAGETTSYLAPFVTSGTIMVNYLGDGAYFSYRVS